MNTLFDEPVRQVAHGKITTERRNAYKSAYKAKHGSSYGQASRRRIRYEVLCQYGGSPPSCACCGERMIEFLGIDHIDGGGAKHRTQIGNARIYSWLKNRSFPVGYRVLCHNCNQSLGSYGYCPHKTPEKSPSLSSDQRVVVGDNNRSAILSAANDLHRQGIRATLDKLVAATGISKAAVQRHRRSLRTSGRWPV